MTTTRNANTESLQERAVSLARRGVQLRHGRPFGAVIVKDGVVVAEGWNDVLQSNDPTVHAEIVAIRNVCRQLETFDLSGSEIYASCEPCVMCLGAIYWSRIAKVYFSVTRRDAAAIAFRDEFIYEELGKPAHDRKVPIVHGPVDGALDVFAAWRKEPGHISY